MSGMPEDELKKAQDYLMDGRGQEARPILVDFIRRNPNSAEGWFLLSFVVAERNRQVECLEHALTIDPGFPHASLRLAQLQSAASLTPSLPPSPETPKVSPFVDTDFNFQDENELQTSQPATLSWLDEPQTAPGPVQPEPPAATKIPSTASAPEKGIAPVDVLQKYEDLPDVEASVNSELPPAVSHPSGLTRDQKIWIWVGVIIFLLLLISFGILYIGTLSVMPTPPPYP